VRLDFLEPGGCGHWKTPATGKPRDILDIPGIGKIEVSLVDAANPCVFLDAKSLGLTGIEMPEALDARRDVLDRIATIRCHASVAMGIAKTVEEARKKSMAANRLSSRAAGCNHPFRRERAGNRGRPHRAHHLHGSRTARCRSRDRCAPRSPRASKAPSRTSTRGREAPARCALPCPPAC